jgi:hypothetical protein
MCFTPSLIESNAMLLYRKSRFPDPPSEVIK